MHACMYVRLIIYACCDRHLVRSSELFGLRTSAQMGLTKKGGGGGHIPGSFSIFKGSRIRNRVPTNGMNLWWLSSEKRFRRCSTSSSPVNPLVKVAFALIEWSWQLEGGVITGYVRAAWRPVLCYTTSLLIASPFVCFFFRSFQPLFRNGIMNEASVERAGCDMIQISMGAAWMGRIASVPRVHPINIRRSTRQILPAC